MNLKSLGVNLLRLVGAAVVFVLLLLASGSLVRPSVPAEAPAYDPKEVAAGVKWRKGIILERKI